MQFKYSDFGFHWLLHERRNNITTIKISKQELKHPSFRKRNCNQTSTSSFHFLFSSFLLIRSLVVQIMVPITHTKPHFLKWATQFYEDTKIFPPINLQTQSKILCHLAWLSSESGNWSESSVLVFHDFFDHSLLIPKIFFTPSWQWWM